jgi:hypothetical protein
MLAVSSPQVVPLFENAASQPRHAAHLPTDREVLALHMRRASKIGIGITHDWRLLRVRDIGMAGIVVEVIKSTSFIIFFRASSEPRSVAIHSTVTAYAPPRQAPHFFFNATFRHYRLT